MDVALLVLLGIITLFSVINCAVRGLKRSLVRLVFIIIAAAITLFVTPLISEPLTKLVSFWELSDNSLLTELAGASPTLGAAVHGAPAAIWSILIYPVVFLLICILMTIPVAIINRKTQRTQNGFGALIGIAVGIIGFSLAFAPLCALGTTVLDAIPEEVLLDEWDVTDLNEMYGLSIDIERILNRDRVLRAEAIPGRPMLDLLTTARENGKSVSISKELRNILTLLPLYTEYASDPESLPKLLPAAADCVEKSALLTDSFNELQDEARKKWSNGEAFLGYDPKHPDGGILEYLASDICTSQTNLTVRDLAEKFEALMNM